MNEYSTTEISDAQRVGTGRSRSPQGLLVTASDPADTDCGCWHTSPFGYRSEFLLRPRGAQHVENSLAHQNNNFSCKLNLAPGPLQLLMSCHNCGSRSVCWTIAGKRQRSASRVQVPTCLFCSCGHRSSLRAQGIGCHALPCVRGTATQTHREHGHAPAGGAQSQRAQFLEGGGLCPRSSGLRAPEPMKQPLPLCFAQIRTRAFKTHGLPGTFLEL